MGRLALVECPELGLSKVSVLDLYGGSFVQILEGLSVLRITAAFPVKATP